MKRLWFYILAGALLASGGCSLPASKQQNVRSKTIELVGGGLLTLQQLPESYGREAGLSSKGYKYFRMLVHDNREHTKDDWAYIDFGLQQDIVSVADRDTLMPAVFHRVANGRKHVYEYLMAFQSDGTKSTTIQINDKILGVGRQTLSFP